MFNGSQWHAGHREPQAVGIFQGLHFHTHTNKYDRTEAVELSNLLKVCLSSSSLWVGAEHISNTAQLPTKGSNQPMSSSYSLSHPENTSSSPHNLSRRCAASSSSSKRSFSTLLLEPIPLEISLILNENEWFKRNGSMNV